MAARSAGNTEVAPGQNSPQTIIALVINFQTDVVLTVVMRNQASHITIAVEKDSPTATARNTRQLISSR